MFNSFIEVQPAAYRFVLAVYLVAATVPLAGGSTTAAAADMPAKAAAKAAPPYQWTGCYIGLNAGGGASGADFTTTVGPGTHLVPADAAEVANDGTGSADVSDYVAGGQAGCNWQTGTLVLGLEGDFDAFRSTAQFANDTNALPVAGVPFVVGQALRTDYLATVRPRIGVAADRNFAYVTGGAAFTKTNYTENYIDAAGPPGIGSVAGSKYLTGWTAGAGWEYAWTDHWTLRAEYLFAKFGTTSASGVIADAAGGANSLQGSGDLIVQVIRAGVNFKF